jgi:hypothetical protein
MLGTISLGGGALQDDSSRVEGGLCVVCYPEANEECRAKPHEHNLVISIEENDAAAYAVYS